MKSSPTFVYAENSVIKDTVSLSIYLCALSSELSQKLSHDVAIYKYPVAITGKVLSNLEKEKREQSHRNPPEEAIDMPRSIRK